MTTPLRDLIVAAQEAIHRDVTISDELAKRIADRVGSIHMSGFAGSFVRYGWVPARYPDVLQMHAELTFGESHPELITALARYLRMRHRNDLTGVGYGWDLALGQSTS